MDLYQAVIRTPKVPPARLVPPRLSLPQSINKRGKGTGEWVEDRQGGGLHLEVFSLSCSHLYTQGEKKKKKKVSVTKGNTTTPGIHRPQHEEG